MELTSNLTFALSATITVALFVLLNIKWLKFKKIWQRVISQLLVQVLLLASVGLYLNNQFSFYSSWSDLFGLSTSTNQNIAPKTIDLSRAQYTKNGSAVIKEVFTGKKSRLTEQVWFLIPKHVVTAIENGSSQKFPAVVFLSGSPGVPTAWLHGLNLDDQIQHAKKVTKLSDFVAILPQFNVIPHKDTGCMNIPDGPQVEDWLIKDVYQYSIGNLPIETSNWGITGYSTGGWCAAMLALKHPEIFKAAAPIAGYYRVQTPFKLSSQARKTLKSEYDLVSLSMAQVSPPDLYLITSTADASTYKETKWFYSKLLYQNHVEILTVQAGGHNFTTWRPLVQDVLNWFSHQLT